MACVGRTLVWWDREIDQAGRSIRPDVRSAGHEIWEEACQRTEVILADAGPAAELMENAVAQVSHYLDRIGAPISSRKHGLVMVAFCRGLRRYANRVNRLQFVGGSAELATRAIQEGWLDQTDASLELEQLVRQLSERNGSVLMLRAAGFQWKEIAQIFEVSVAAIRNGFWREMNKIMW